MESSSPAYLWYPNDALSSGRIEELSAAEECWYRRALDRSWMDNGVPSDPVRLAKRIGKKCTEKAAKMILEMFFEPSKKDPSKMINPRQEIERKKFLEKFKKKSEAGRLSGVSRRKQRQLDIEQNANKTRTKSNISISISNTKKEERKQAKESHARTQVSFDDFVKSLRSNPAYSHIDLDVELAKAEAWTVKHGKRFTSKFVTDWMNRIEVPLRTNHKAVQHQPIDNDPPPLAEKLRREEEARRNAKLIPPPVKEVGNVH